MSGEVTTGVRHTHVVTPTDLRAALLWPRTDTTCPECGHSTTAVDRDGFCTHRAGCGCSQLLQPQRTP